MCLAHCSNDFLLGIRGDLWHRNIQDVAVRNRRVHRRRGGTAQELFECARLAIRKEEFRRDPGRPKYAEPVAGDKFTVADGIDETDGVSLRAHGTNENVAWCRDVGRPTRGICGLNLRWRGFAGPIVNG